MAKMNIDIKVVSESLGMNPKAFRKLLRTGKIPNSRKDENGRWVFDFEAMPTRESLGINNIIIQNKEKKERKHKEKKEEKFFNPEYLTDNKEHWYGLKVEGGRESEIKSAIEFLNIPEVSEVFVPTQNVIDKNKRKRVQSILTKIVFVKANKLMDIIPRIKEASSRIKGFWMSMPDLKGNKVPALIDEETVTSLKELHERDITEEQIHGFEVNKMVEVTSGPFKHAKGFIKSMNGNIMNIEMDILGRTLPIHISADQLRVIVEE